ncbi:hypothetical protein L208DRAFT_1238794, partial [Tricholoma matsutake]
LIHHGVPTQWIDHMHTFGLHHLNHQSHLRAGLFQDLYCKTDRKCLRRLDTLGEPVAIPQWDGWWCPTYHDITRIQYLIGREDNGMGKSCFLDFEWLLASALAMPRELTGKMPQP